MTALAVSAQSTLSNRGFPPMIIESWERDGFRELLPLQIKALAEEALFEQSGLIIGPTSCGKTFVGELICVRHALNRRRCVYLVPFKALAEEKYREFRRKYGHEAVGAQIVISTADRRTQDRALVDGDFNIAIMTYEKLAAIMVTHPRLLTSVGAVVVDEVQMLRDPSRGADLELLMTRARQIAPNIQIIGLSAVVSELNGFDEWLGACIVSDDHRPVPLREGVIARDGLFKFVEWDGENRDAGQEQFPPLTGISEEELAVGLAAHLLSNPNEQVLVFSPTVAATQQLAQQIAKRAENIGPAKEPLERLAGLEPTESNTALNHTLASSVAFHNADLDLSERLIVEEAFRLKQARCIVSTSTLSMGINLPASSVIIVKTMKWTRDRGRWMEVPVPVAEYRNMSGRAGRFGLNSDALGRSFVIARSPLDQSSAMTAYVQAEPEPLHSALLSKPMADLLLKTLASRLCDTADGCYRFLLKTFAARTHFRGESGQIAAKQEIEAAIATLTGAELIELDKKGKLTVTALGMICAASGLEVQSFRLVANAVRRFTPSATDIAYLSSMLSDAGPDAVGLRMSGTEHHGRGRGFIRAVGEAAEQENAPLTAAMLAELPSYTFPSYEAIRTIKFQAVAIAFVNGLASQEIEESLGASAGKARAVGSSCARISDTASKIAWALDQREDAKQFETLSERFLHGCSERALLLASVPHNLHRAEREALIRAGYHSLQSILDASSIEIAKTARVNRHRVEQLQSGIIEVIGESLTLERQQLARLQGLGESSNLIESLYTLKGTMLEQAIEALLVEPFCPLTVTRIATQREGEADLRIILSTGHNGIAQVTAKDLVTDKIGLVKATSVLSQSPDLRPKAFICFGRPDFLPESVKKANEHAANGTNFKLIPVQVLVEMYVRFKEGVMTAADVQRVLETEVGCIDIGRLPRPA